MKIGLLIAIKRELAAFLQSGEERTEETVAGKTVYRTRMEGHEVYAIQSGCGEIDAAAATMLLIVKYGCEVILNFGVTGALEEDLKVEDLFVAEKAWHYDFDVTPFTGCDKIGQYEEYQDDEEYSEDAEYSEEEYSDEEEMAYESDGADESAEENDTEE